MKTRTRKSNQSEQGGGCCGPAPQVETQAPASSCCSAPAPQTKVIKSSCC